MLAGAASAFSCTQDPSFAINKPSETQWALSAPSELSCLTIVVSPSTLLIFRFARNILAEDQGIFSTIQGFAMFVPHLHHKADTTKDLGPAGEVAGAKEYMALDVCQRIP